MEFDGCDNSGANVAFSAISTAIPTLYLQELEFKRKLF
jgi:hypothetical protein